jgi:hypothetical protein
VVGCWDQIQDICDFSNGFQTLDLTTGILYVVLIHSSIPSRRLINKLSSSFCCISPLESINIFSYFYYYDELKYLAGIQLCVDIIFFHAKDTLINPYILTIILNFFKNIEQIFQQ